MEEALDPLTEKEREFLRVIELADIQTHIRPYRRQGIGRRRKGRPKKAAAGTQSEKAACPLFPFSISLQRGWRKNKENRPL